MDRHRRATATVVVVVVVVVIIIIIIIITVMTIITSTMMTKMTTKPMMIMMELLTIKLRFVTVLNPYYFKISLAIFFARKNILCEVLRCYICIVSYGLRFGRVPRFILLWAQKYLKPALLWDDTLQRGTLK